jgi:phage/plasmid-like protein (TIGR03299 family)
MTANVGRMFWYGETPWHGEGRQVPRPLTWEEALREGDLDWTVGDVALWAGQTEPGTRQASPFDEVKRPAGPLAFVRTRKALFRSDRAENDPGGVVGVVHNDFVPLQNREGLRAFDDVFGQGRRIYETGGWLGNGERVWLLARGGESFEPVKGDEVGRYVLFANSHDGSTAIRVRRTAVRVVCQNTFTLALRGASEAPELRTRHAVSADVLRKGLERLRDAWKAESAKVEEELRLLARRRAPSGGAERLLDELFPPPKSPAERAAQGVVLAFERRFAAAQEARRAVLRLAEEGHGTQIPGVRGSLWGLFNAVTEYVDHHAGEKSSGPGWSLLGGGEALKAKAWGVVRELARAA